jgi:hypothetical protein
MRAKPAPDRPRMHDAETGQTTGPGPRHQTTARLGRTGRMA